MKKVCTTYVLPSKCISARYSVQAADMSSAVIMCAPRALLRACRPQRAKPDCWRSKYASGHVPAADCCPKDVAEAGLRWDGTVSAERSSASAALPNELPGLVLVVDADSTGAGSEDAKSMPVADVREARGDRLRFESPSLGCWGKMPLEASCMGRCGETTCS